MRRINRRADSNAAAHSEFSSGIGRHAQGETTTEGKADEEQMTVVVFIDKTLQGTGDFG